MSKRKSIVLTTIIAIVLVVLTVMTFVRFTVPFYKNGTYNFNSILGAITLDQDIDDGVAYDLTLKDNIDASDVDINEKAVINTLKARLKALGYENAIVNAYRASETENYSFHIEMRASETYSQDISVVAAYGELVFYDGDGNEITTGDEAVKSAKYVGPTTTADTNHYVELKFTNEGYSAIKSAIDAAESEFKLSIKLGETEVFSSALNADYIQNNTLYITSSNRDTAEQLALQISSGGLEYEYEISEAYVVENSVDGIFWGVTIAIIVSLLIMIVLYRGFGLLSAISVYAFILVELVMMILVPGIILSAGGIFGILTATLMTTVMLVDVMERVKKEYAMGKTVKAAVKAGYNKSLAFQLEACGAVGVFALAIFALCAGYVKNFAITLGIGAAVCALAVTCFSRLVVSVMLPLLKNKSEGFLKLTRDGGEGNV